MAVSVACQLLYSVSLIDVYKMHKYFIFVFPHVVLTMQWLVRCVTPAERHKYWVKCLFLWQSFVIID